MRGRDGLWSWFENNCSHGQSLRIGRFEISSFDADGDWGEVFVKVNGRIIRKYEVDYFKNEVDQIFSRAISFVIASFHHDAPTILKFEKARSQLNLRF